VPGDILKECHKAKEQCGGSKDVIRGLTIIWLFLLCPCRNHPQGYHALSDDVFLINQLSNKHSFSYKDLRGLQSQYYCPLLIIIFCIMWQIILFSFGLKSAGFQGSNKQMMISHKW